VSAHHDLGEAAYDGRVTLGVDALAAHDLAHLLVERLDQVCVCGNDRQGDPSPSKRSVPATYDGPHGRRKGHRPICG
jgi:hypothetical protein